MSERYSSILFSESIIVLTFIVKVLIHSELIFVFVVKQGFRFLFFFCVVVRRMVHQRCPYSNPQNLYIHYVTWKKEIKVADIIKCSNLLTLK